NACWSGDNRTVMIRVIGIESIRFEFRLPGADVNPYLSFAAILAAGLEGMDQELKPPAPVAGNAYSQNLPALPGDLDEAIVAFRNSELAARSFTPAVHRHLVSLACKERDEHRRAVTGWQVRRYFDTV